MFFSVQFLNFPDLANSSSDFDCPSSLISLWKPALKVIQSHGLTRDLVLALLERLGQEGEGERGEGKEEGGERVVKDRLIVGWIQTSMKLYLKSTGVSYFVINFLIVKHVFDKLFALS